MYSSLDSTFASDIDVTSDILFYTLLISSCSHSIFFKNNIHVHGIQTNFLSVHFTSISTVWYSDIFSLFSLYKYIYSLLGQFYNKKIEIGKIDWTKKVI